MSLVYAVLAILVVGFMLKVLVSVGWFTRPTVAVAIPAIGKKEELSAWIKRVSKVTSEAPKFQPSPASVFARKWGSRISRMFGFLSIGAKPTCSTVYAVASDMPGMVWAFIGVLTVVTMLMYW